MSGAERVVQKLVDMANQIADYFQSFPESEAAPGIADHIEKFWTPKMRATLIDHLDHGAIGLAPLAAEGVRILKAHAAQHSN